MINRVRIFFHAQGMTNLLEKEKEAANHILLMLYLLFLFVCFYIVEAVVCY